MMGEVRSINAEKANRANDNTLLSPVECLEDAARDIRSGERACDKVLVLTVDTSDEQFTVGFYAAQIKGSEMVAALEAMKMRILSDMGFTG